MTTGPRALPARSRVLYVVARDRPDLYAAFRATFTDSSRLGIVLDRRGTGAGDVPAAERVAAERRRLALDESLRTRGWARVRIAPDGRAALAEGTGPSLETSPWP